MANEQPDKRRQMGQKEYLYRQVTQIFEVRE